MICHYFEEPLYFLYVPDLSGLLYYTHVPALIAALLVGTFVLWNDRRALQNQLLFAICLSFSVWTFGTLVAWTNIHSDTLLFAWSFLGPAAGFLSIFSIYFTYVFLEKKDVGLKTKAIFLVLLAPLLLLAASKYTLGGFNLVNCDAFGFEGLTNTVYFPALGVLAMLWILALLVKHYRHAEKGFKKQIVLIGTGMELFLFSFFVAIFLGQYLATAGIMPDSQLETYGYFGMIAFLVYIGILVVRFKAFHVSLIASQALVAALVILIGSQLTFVRSTTNLILTAITLAVTILIGFVLIRSVKREIHQRERIEKLATDLKVSNEQLSEFMSLATHEIRNPATAIKGIASNVLEGLMGETVPTVRDAVQKMFVRANDIINLGNQYLNKSKLELNQIAYTFETFPLDSLIENLVYEFQPAAEQKGISIKASIDKTLDTTVCADKGKVKEVIGNLIDNAMKYTPANGSGTVSILKSDTTVTVKIADTGPGIPAETIPKLFKKFSRADAAQANLLGTGLGLYLAKIFVDAHHGKIWVESEGLGKGSTFFVEFPIKQEQKEISSAPTISRSA